MQMILVVGSQSGGEGAGWMGGKNGWVGAARGGVGPPLFLVDEKVQPNRNLLAVAATSV